MKMFNWLKGLYEKYGPKKLDWRPNEELLREFQKPHYTHEAGGRVYNDERLGYGAMSEGDLERISKEAKK